MSSQLLSDRLEITSANTTYKGSLTVSDLIFNGSTYSVIANPFAYYKTTLNSSSYPSNLYFPTSSKYIYDNSRTSGNITSGVILTSNYYNYYNVTSSYNYPYRVYFGTVSVSKNDSNIATIYSSNLEFYPLGVVIGSHAASSTSTSITSSAANLQAIARIYNNTVYIYTDDLNTTKTQYIDYMIFGY